MPAKDFSLTHVVYDDELLSQKILALVTLSPIFIIVAYVALLYSRRQIHTLFMLIGQLVNEGLNNILKQYIKEPRPHGCKHSGYGMPSSHAQFMGYFGGFCILWSLVLGSNVDFISDKKTGNAFIILLSLLVTYSRVELGYHTETQVIVGGILGVCFAAIWSLFISTIVDPHIRNIEELWIAKFFYFRDSKWMQHNLFLFEYESAIQDKTGRKKKS
mmetsp:Transcript_10484/g.16811  ORF Transcript_10484/g.16811 Transcript_10484/m.16811 type:complete len:216 (-) Transcript_10484:91-738(-)